MNKRTFAERVDAMVPNYELAFAKRGNITPSDPLEFHLYHLARYWSRLAGFCSLAPSNPETFINGDLGACVAVGSEFTHQSIGSTSPIYQLWQECWRQTQVILYKRPVGLDDVEAAHTAFNECLAALKYDPWVWHPKPKAT